MKPENAIEVRNVTKQFKIYMDKGHTLKERTLFKNRRKHEVRNVLNGISFDVKKGEAIGLIGHNGCGKSTTLKLLTKIMYPDSGSIEMRGRVSSLIELGAGFHPDMSGRENIYINASIFGLTKKEIEQREKDIIEFSELEEFIDNPVRTYSSGMYMRLAFAVAINVDADILLIDEILAVGDAAFQAKCFKKLRQIKGEGTTIIIVSHSLTQIEQICDRSIWIHKGKIKEDGLPRIVDPHYLEYMSRKHGGEEITSPKNETIKKEIDNTEKDDGEKKRWGSGEVIITHIDILDRDGKHTDRFASNESCKIVLGYKTTTRVMDAVIGVAIYRDDQTYVYGTNTMIDSSTPVTFDGEGEVVLDINQLPLNTGTYTLDFALHKSDGFNYDFWREALSIEVENPHQEVGVLSINHVWSYN